MQPNGRVTMETSDQQARDFAVIKTSLMSIEINHKRNHTANGEITNFYSWCFSCLWQVNQNPEADELTKKMFDVIRSS